MASYVVVQHERAAKGVHAGDRSRNTSERRCESGRAISGDWPLVGEEWYDGRGRIANSASSMCYMTVAGWRTRRS